MNDLRLGFRALRATPVVSAVAVISLALGIGAATAIFTLINGLMLRPLPVSEPDRLAFLGDTARESRGWSNPIWEQIRGRPQLFEGALAWGRTQFNLARGGEARLIDGIWASGDFFRVLGVPAFLGRTFTPEDDRRGGGPDGPVAVISYDFWRTHFGAAGDVIGKPLTVGSIPFTIIGVAPRGFFGPEVGQTFDVIVPLGTEPLLAGVNSGLDSRGRTWLTVMIRRRTGEPIETATAGLRAVQQEIRDVLPLPDPRLAQDLQEPFALAIASSGRSSLRARYQHPLIMLLIVSVGVLLIACVNIANLLMARATARRHEMSLRVALGASRTRLVRLLLSEAAMLSGMGALLGIVFAQWMGRLIIQQISTPGNVVYLDLSPDWKIWLFATTIGGFAAALFGGAPAWRSMHADPVDALRENGRGTVGGGGSLFSAVLVGTQVALSLALVVAAGLFIRTSAELARQNVGASKDRVLLVGIAAPMTRYTLSELVGTYERVLDAVKHVRGVERAALSDITPAGGSARTLVVGVPGSENLPERDRLVSVNVISPGWLQTYGVRLLAGRDVQPTDQQGAQAVVLVNEAFAHRFFRGGNPVGHFLSVPGNLAFVGTPGGTITLEIVGLVEDAVYRSLREPAVATMYASTGQRSAARSYANIAVLAAQGAPAVLSRDIAAAVRGIDPELSLQFLPLSEQVRAAMTQERVVALLSAFFGGLALLLAGLGLYGVTTYGVSRRRAEIAMRMALGADSAGIVGLVMRRIAVVVAAGTLCGAGLSLWASQFVGTLVWGLEPRDPATFVTAAIVLASVATVAGGLPAWRATRVSPAEILKEV